jgi:hypothetical protein
VSNRAHGGRALPRVVRTAALVVAAGLGADYLRNHPNADNAGNPADAADALQMVAALRNIQAGMAASCGLTMDQAMNPGLTPGH